jgi:glucosamine-6-phosphate deaminase
MNGEPPDLRIVDDYVALSVAAADVIAEIVAAEPDAAIVVATGETPMGAYAELARMRAAGSLDASRLRAFQLDDYVGVGVDDPRSLLGWTLRSFVTPLGIAADHVVPIPTDGDLATACADYDRAVADAGGFTLAILGIGANGHVGFNEPPTEPGAPTREVVLSPESAAANARYWGDGQPVPARAVTAGMRQLLGARTTLLLASGSGKRAILHEALEGPIVSQVPASLLRRGRRVIVVADRAAWGET